MATVAHGCSSPRQRSCNGSSSPGGGGVGGSGHHGGSTPAMYTTMPKYTRAASQTLYATSQQIFGGGGGAGSGAPPGMDNSYNGGLYMSSGTMSQRPLSASALPETAAGCRNYWSQSQGHTGPGSFYHSSGRHYNYNKRKSAVELLAESKPFYIKSDAVFERLQQSAGYRNATSGGVVNGAGGAGGVKRGRRPDEGHYSGASAYDELEDRRYMSLTRQQQAQLQQSNTLHNHHQQQQQQSLPPSSSSQQQQQHHHHRHNSGQTSLGHRSGMTMNNNLLQHKLRMLLGSEASKERGGGTLRRHDDDRADLLPGDYGAEDESSALRIPPPLYMPSHGYTRESSYGGYPSEPNSSGEEPLVLTENYRPISPPAEYAAKSSQAHNERYR